MIERHKLTKKKIQYFFFSFVFRQTKSSQLCVLHTSADRENQIVQRDARDKLRRASNRNRIQTKTDDKAKESNGKKAERMNSNNDEVTKTAAPMTTKIFQTADENYMAMSRQNNATEPKMPNSTFFVRFRSSDFHQSETK